MPPTVPNTIGADLISAVAAESNEELQSGLAEDFAQMSAAQARFVVRLGEYDRRQAFRDEGATSLESWTAERFGISIPTARSYAHVGEKAWDIPHLIGALRAGEISFDKVRVLSDAATPESDQELCDQARECSVRELADIARTSAELARPPSSSRSQTEHDGRFLRFNDAHPHHQRPAAGRVLRRTQGRHRCPTRPDPLRRRDALGPAALRRLRWGSLRSLWPDSAGRAATASPYVVVAHVPLAALVEDSGETSHLAGELERHGLIDGETVQADRL